MASCNCKKFYFPNSHRFVVTLWEFKIFRPRPPNLSKIQPPTEPRNRHGTSRSTSTLAELGTLPLNCSPERSTALSMQHCVVMFQYKPPDWTVEPLFFGKERNETLGPKRRRSLLKNSYFLQALCISMLVFSGSNWSVSSSPKSQSQTSWKWWTKTTHLVFDGSFLRSTCWQMLTIWHQPKRLHKSRRSSRTRKKN